MEFIKEYPKEELNAPIGLVIHMLGLIVRYLGIKLPFVIFRKGANPYIKMTTPYARPWHNNRLVGNINHSCLLFF
jgi:hypothetical protein